jgi:nucleotide-binding universal stress UspA family protein
VKRILVPSNCDEASARALKLATALSEKNNARVYVLRVIKTHGGALFNKDGEIVENGSRDIQKYVDQKAEETERLDKWTTAISPGAFQVVKYGGVADVILDTIKKYKVGLVIMGNNYVKNEKSNFFGDLTSNLINNSHAPILSLKAEITLENLNHIVFANEFNHKLSYYDALQDLHNLCNTKIDMLRVNVPKGSSEEEINENMDYFARSNMINDFSKNIIQSNSKPEPAILDWISNNPCDILAVKNVTTTLGGSPLFRKKLSKQFLKNTHVSTLIYND